MAQGFQHISNLFYSQFHNELIVRTRLPVDVSICNVSYKSESWPGMIVRRVAQLTRAQVHLEPDLCL